MRSMKSSSSSSPAVPAAASAAVSVPASVATEPTAVRAGRGAPRRYDRAAVVERVCAELRAGRSLNAICTSGEGLPSAGRFLEWVEADDPPGIAEMYARARQVGYSLLAEELVQLADKTHEWVMVPETDSDGWPVLDAATGEPRLRRVLMPLNADVIAHKRVQIDTRKWMLAKMLPRVYGDKTTTELTGADGGPITVAAMNVRGLSDKELDQLQALMSKAAAAAPPPTTGSS